MSDGDWEIRYVGRGWGGRVQEEGGGVQRATVILRRRSTLMRILTVAALTCLLLTSGLVRI